MRYRSWNLRLIFLLLLCTSLPALAQVNWPNGPALCDDPSSLQLCIESQPDGTIIEVNADLISQPQAVDVDQSLTIRAAEGFSPVFEDEVELGFGNINGPVAVVIEGLRFQLLNLVVRQSNGDAELDFTFSNNVVENLFAAGFRIAGSSESATAPIRYTIENNLIRSQDRQSSVINIVSAWASGNEGLIQNNLFEVVDITQAAVLDIRGPIGAMTDMTVDVIANRFQGINYNAGVVFRHEEGGRLEGRIINNVVIGQNGEGALPAALGVRASDSTSEGDIWIINNTLAVNRDGIAILTDAAPQVGTFMFNNVVANSQQQNFNVIPGSVVVADYNLGFAPGIADQFTPGPSFIEADPLFIADADPQPQAGSPAIDSGDSGVVPADIVSDFAGNGRILGVRVDRGAFEWVQPFPESVAVPTLNTAGLIMLILLCLVIGLMLRPRYEIGRK